MYDYIYTLSKTQNNKIQKEKNLFYHLFLCYINFSLLKYYLQGFTKPLSSSQLIIVVSFFCSLLKTKW